MAECMAPCHLYRHVNARVYGKNFNVYLITVFAQSFEIGNYVFAGS